MQVVQTTSAFFIKYFSNFFFFLAKSDWDKDSYEKFDSIDLLNSSESD